MMILKLRDFGRWFIDNAQYVICNVWSFECMNAAVVQMLSIGTFTAVNDSTSFGWRKTFFFFM